MKYIIDIPIKLLLKDDGYSFSDGNSYCITGNLSKLTPYTESDRKAIEDEVWEFVSMLMNMHPDVAEDIYWSMNGGKGIGVAAEMSYQEAKSKFEAWMKQKDEIHVGDEVEYEDCKFVVTAEIGGRYHGIHSSNGNVVRFGEGDYCRKDNCKKTGRHFDEMAKLLDKMRGEEE